MESLNSKIKKIVSELENKIQDKEELEFVKERILQIYNMMFEEINRLEESANEKIARILEIQIGLESRISKSENDLKEIQEDIYGEENDFQVACPYCNEEFYMENIESKDEVTCPECSNVIELDWGNDDEEEMSGGGCCGSSKGGCCGMSSAGCGPCGPMAELEDEDM